MPAQDADQHSRGVGIETDQHNPLVLPAGRNTPPIEDRESLRIISWNVYRNNRPSAIEASLTGFVTRYSPDIILVQEAPAYEASHFADLPVFEGYHKIYEPMHIPGRARRRSALISSVGQLTLSKRPFVETTAFQFPALPSRARRSDIRKESVRRVALYTRFETLSGRHIGCYNVHLENRTFPSGRLKQIEYLLQLIEQRNDQVVVIGGDFNTFLTSAFEPCLRPFYREGFVNLFRDVRMRLIPRLDYFMVRGAGVARRVRLRGRGSDHQPIMAELEL